MYIYIVIYLSLFLLLLSERIRGISNRQKKIIMLATMLFLILFRGLRWETGTDWEQFHDFFYSVTFDSFFGSRYANSQVAMEPGYTLLNLLFLNLIGNYTSFLIFCNAVILLIYYNCSWKYFPESPLNAFICLILFTSIFPLRQAFAVAIFLYGIRYILSKSILKFGIIIAFAASIHNSAILMFPCYFFLNKHISSKMVIISYIACLILAESPFLNLIIMQIVSIFAMVIGVDPSLLMKVYTYLKYDKDVNSGLFVTIFFFLLSIVFISIFCLFRYRNKVSSNYNIFFNCFVLSLCIGILFKYQMQEIIRMQDYFMLGTALLLGYILGALPTNKRNILYIFIIFYSFYTIYKFFDLWYILLVPYKSVIGV
jgi:hypothetical protein